MKTQNNISRLKVMLLLVACIAFSSLAMAQTNLSGPTNVYPSSTETYTYNDGTTYIYDGWNITNGTLISSSENQTTYTAVVQWWSTGSGSVAFKKKETILETLSVTVNPPPPTVVTDLNYIHNITPRVATTDVSTIHDGNKIEAITYFDGLGRARQSVGIRAGGDFEDIITHIEYDEFGRNVKDYLPYSSSTNIGTYRTDALSATNTYYDASAYNDDFPGMTVADINPYSEKEFDNSPLNRVLKQAAPGKDWKLGNGHEIEMDYLTNATNEVRDYTVDLTKYTSSSGVVTYAPSLSSANGFYTANELYKTVTKDENHDGNSKDHTTEEFKNKQGQVILKRTYDKDTAHDTYYVYDDYGNLSFVLSPKSEAHADKPNATELSELCYQYKYDDRNRLVEKKIPGKGWEYIIYNKIDQPIMTQDTELKNDGKWLVTKYDAFGRVVYTAIKDTPATRVSLQGLFNNDPSTVLQYESRTTGTGYLNTYYTSVARPTIVDEILTINYYDDYGFTTSAEGPEVAYGVTPTTAVKGLATGSKVRVLGTNDWITTVSYYDEKSRPIYIYSYNEYLNISDKVKSKLTFDGRTIETTSIHAKAFTSPITIIDEYDYDHANRLISHKQKINNAALYETIASNRYDDLGQLNQKGVGGKENAARLQNVNYDYNVRGWLKAINDVNGLDDNLFGFKINYNTEDHNGTKLYNGNISETEWKTKNDNVLRWYAYDYDALNRLIQGTASDTNYNLTSVAYDKNGNITSLNRNGHTNAQATAFGIMDNLAYTYETSSNRLKKVNDTGSFNYGFKDGSLNATEYTYDDNGNMISDDNKDITSINYNHLNLPTNVNFVSGDISYIYDATGVKQKKIVSTGTTTEYAGNYIYENGSLQMFSHPEGYVEQIKAGKVPVFGYFYQYKDHLGNIRLTYGDSDGNGEIKVETEIVEENNYYPFGLKHKGYNDVVSANVNSVAQNFTYLGQEEQNDLGLGWLTFRYRNYMPDIGRFFGVDPVSSEYMSISTYQFAHNNPVWKIEIEGLEGATSTGDGNDDTTNHEPVKVSSQSRATSANGFKGTNPLEKATKPATKTVQKSVQKNVVLKALTSFVKGAGTTIGALLTTWSLDEPQPTDFMPDMIDMPLPSEEPAPIIEPEDTPVAPVDEDDDDKDVIYRGGSFTDKNFTPRPGKDDGTGPKSGLSTFRDPIKTLMFSGGKAQELSVNKLRALGFQLNETPDGHVGIRPPSQAKLEEWAKSRNLEGESSAHILTQMVKSARIQEVRTPN